ncbi:TPA: hypothetical protein V0F36_001526 [Streptococcus pneumoniae]|nr:hypothetical protein [Streptococcus pneumoniae]
MDYQILIQPAISVILAIISGLWSYIASKANNKAEIEKQAKEHSHIVEKLEKEFHYQIDTLTLELEKVKQAHELRLQELEKVSQIDTETDKAMKMNDLIYKTFTGEVDLDKALKLADKANNHKQKLNKKFIQKTSKKS